MLYFMHILFISIFFESNSDSTLLKIPDSINLPFLNAGGRFHICIAPPPILEKHPTNLTNISLWSRIECNSLEWAASASINLLFMQCAQLWQMRAFLHCTTVAHLMLFFSIKSEIQGFLRVLLVKQHTQPLDSAFTHGCLRSSAQPKALDHRLP